MLTINQKVEVSIIGGNPKKIPTKVGTIVYIFPKLQIPDKDLVIKYYGEEVVQPKYAALFGPNKSDRYVVEFESGGYGIYPHLGIDRYHMIKEIL